MTNNRTVAVGAAAAAGVVASIYLWQKSHAEKAKPLHVLYMHPKMPTALTVMASLPRFVRLHLAVKGAAPKCPKDSVDVLEKGEKHPYQFTEIVKGRVWRVRYTHLVDNKIRKIMLQMFGIDMNAPDMAERGGPAMKETIESDLEYLLSMEKVGEGLKGKDRDVAILEAGGVSTADMLVARIGTDGKGGLLLYNPCRIHPPLKEWFSSLDVGPVKYIVSGSSAHTNQLKLASEMLPSAKIVCSSAAEIKCKSVGMRPADVLYTDPQALAKLNKELSSTGISMHHVFGDVGTQALCVLAHKHLFEVDLLYGHSDQTRFTNVEKDDWPDVNNKRVALVRLFYYALMAKGSTSPNGVLPVYRYMMMDPTSPLTKMAIDAPKPDGSSCADMAESLRKVLALDFTHVDSAHSLRDTSIPGEEFRECMDAGWRWLDGGSLLSKVQQKRYSGGTAM